MFAKRTFHKALVHHQGGGAEGGGGGSASAPASPGDVIQMDALISTNCGVPYTASLLAFDSVQRLLAVATLDGRIKILGGDSIEGLLYITKECAIQIFAVSYKPGAFGCNSNENEIQVWNLEFRQLFYLGRQHYCFCSHRGDLYDYLGDENGLLSVLKYDVDDGKLQIMPYNVHIQSSMERAGVLLRYPQPIVGIVEY